MNDSLRGSVFLRYSPAHTSCACIVLAARLLKIQLPDNPSWWKLFDLTENVLFDVCKHIMCLYKNDYVPKISDIEQFLEQKRKESGISVVVFTIEDSVNVQELEVAAAKRKDSNRDEDTQAKHNDRPNQEKSHVPARHTRPISPQKRTHRYHEPHGISRYSRHRGHH
ncbi:Cyclin-L1 [Thelohanellus kitauei]|uniref:Cyclin-L1 n=1 Tax=Thelohanellus kitauei TaxID=669202 RepID=A0A0C2NI81_THEKT|nr:Cyclin-L1 [Thelohanellus kitauei]